MALAAFAGIRSSELEGLDWKHIRLLEEAKADQIVILDIDVTEEASKRTIEIDETLRGFLGGLYRREGKLWTGTHHAFYRMQQKIAKKAGVKWEQNAMRHTAISAKVARTKNIGQVALESGNSPTMIKKHYLNLMTPSQAEAWFGVTWGTVLQLEHRNKVALRDKRQESNNGKMAS